MVVLQLRVCMLVPAAGCSQSCVSDHLKSAPGVPAPGPLPGQSRVPSAVRASETAGAGPSRRPRPGQALPLNPMLHQ